MFYVVIYKSHDMNIVTPRTFRGHFLIISYKGNEFHLYIELGIDKYSAMSVNICENTKLSGHMKLFSLLLLRAPMVSFTVVVILI